MTALRARLEVAALQALLTVLGVLMVLASRRMDRFRRQVTRNLLIEIRSADGARQQYRLHAATRRMTLPRRPVEHAECTLVFPTARVGLRARVAPRPWPRITSGGRSASGMNSQPRHSSPAEGKATSSRMRVPWAMEGA